MITIKSNIDEQVEKVIVSLNKIEPSTELGSRIVRSVALGVLALMVDRIQGSGQATDGRSIGQYSTKPIYVNVKNSPGNLGAPLGKPIGGRRSSKFKNGRRHTSRFFDGGYRQYKKTVFPSIKGVNLTLTGQMMSQLTVIPTGDGNWGLGWKNGDFAERARYFEKVKYKKRIFGASLRERQEAVKIAKRLIRNALSK